MERSCSEWSLEVGEPLAGTAVESELWLVLEHAGPWGPKGADDSGLSPELVAQLAGFASQNRRSRVQLIRRPDRKSGSIVYLARSTPGEGVLLRRSFARLDDLGGVDLSVFAAGGVPEGFEQVAGPLYLVCVHGRRDRCCALRGMPVYSALAELRPDAAFQTTHLGGHRFAATMLVLPDGICYGRVEAAEMPALVAAHDAGRMYALARVRGRCAYPAAAQAAEMRLRETLGEHELTALSLLGTSEPAQGVIEVRFRQRSSGIEHAVRVEKRGLEPSAQSCGATPKASQALIALTSR